MKKFISKLFSRVLIKNKNITSSNGKCISFSQWLNAEESMRSNRGLKKPMRRELNVIFASDSPSLLQEMESGKQFGVSSMEIIALFCDDEWQRHEVINAAYKSGKRAASLKMIELTSFDLKGNFVGNQSLLQIA